MDKRWIVMMNTRAGSRKGGYGWQLRLEESDQHSYQFAKKITKDREECRQAVCLCVEDDRTLSLVYVLGDPLTQVSPTERILPYQWSRYSQMLATAYYIVCSEMPDQPTEEGAA